MKFNISIIFFLLCVLPLYAQNYDPFIADLMNQTNLDSLTSFVRILSGEYSVMPGESTVLIQHRINYLGNDLAAEYLKQKLESYGLDTYDQLYSEDGRNIYAIQPGTLYANQLFLICAHYDPVD